MILHAANRTMTNACNGSHCGSSISNDSRDPQVPRDSALSDQRSATDVGTSLTVINVRGFIQTGLAALHSSQPRVETTTLISRRAR